MQNWIDCKEKLPEPDVEVLTQLSEKYDRDKCIMTLCEDTYVANCGENNLYWKTSEMSIAYDLEDIDAWMPLPYDYIPPVYLIMGKNGVYQRAINGKILAWTTLEGARQQVEKTERLMVKNGFGGWLGYMEVIKLEIHNHEQMEKFVIADEMEL